MPSLGTALSTAQDASLTGAVEHVKAQPSIVLPSSHPALAGNGLTSTTATFCEFWPIAKETLAALQHFMPWWMASVLGPIISIGDHVCGKA